LLIIIIIQRAIDHIIDRLIRFIGTSLTQFVNRDYVAAPELDYYDPEGLADDEVNESWLDVQQYRQAAEMALDKMDGKR